MSIKRWAIRDAGIAHFYNLVTKKLVVSLPTLKTAGVEFSGETSYARGGFGNVKIVGFSSNREGTLTLQDAIFDNDALAMLTGNDPTVGAATIGYNEVLTVATNKITLTNTPVGALVGVHLYEEDGTNGTEYTVGTPDTNPTDYSIAAKVVTFNAAVTDGTQIRVYYTVQTSADATTVKVSSDQFGKSFRVELDCIVVDEFEKKAYKAQIQIPTAKFEDNFSFNLAVDGDPAVLDLVLELLKPANSVDMFKMVIYDEDALV